jgi:hypothetical protein
LLCKRECGKDKKKVNAEAFSPWFKNDDSFFKLLPLVLRVKNIKAKTLNIN